MMNRTAYLERSPYEADCGELVGKDPRKIARALLGQLGSPESPIKAIRAKCLDCSGNSEGEVRKCVSVTCALWPFRMGTNVFHANAAQR